MEAHKYVCKFLQFIFMCKSRLTLNDQINSIFKEIQDVCAACAGSRHTGLCTPGASRGQ